MVRIQAWRIGLVGMHMLKSKHARHAWIAGSACGLLGVTYVRLGVEVIS